MGNNFIKYILWFLVIVWMVIIFALSNTSANKSSNDSRNVFGGMVNISTKITNSIGITNFSRNDLKIIINNYNGLFREFMHSFVYFVLIILLLLALKYSDMDYECIISLFICLIYALSDEVHQIFISGRTFQLIDLFLDSLGVLFGIILYKLIYINKIKNLRHVKL